MSAVKYEHTLLRSVSNRVVGHRHSRFYWRLVFERLAKTHWWHPVCGWSQLTTIYRRCDFRRLHIARGGAQCARRVRPGFHRAAVRNVLSNRRRSNECHIDDGNVIAAYFRVSFRGVLRRLGSRWQTF